MKTSTVSYQEVKDRIYNHLGCLDLDKYPLPLIAGGSVASSILSIIDGVEYPFGDIDIFFPSDQYFEVLELVQRDLEDRKFTITLSNPYEYPSVYRSLKNLEMVDGGFAGTFDGTHYSTSEPLKFIDAREYSTFSNLSSEDQEDFLSMLYFFEKDRNSERVKRAYSSDLKIEPRDGSGPTINIVFTGRRRSNISKILTEDFDLSCCRVGLYPSIEHLAITSSFETFVTERRIEVFKVTSNEGLIQRFFKYLDRFNLSFYKNNPAIIPYLNLLGLPRGVIMDFLFGIWTDLPSPVLRMFAFSLIQKRFQSHRLIYDKPLFQSQVDRVNAFYGFEFLTVHDVKPYPATTTNPPELTELHFALKDFSNTRGRLIRNFRRLELGRSDGIKASPTFTFQTYEDS